MSKAVLLSIKPQYCELIASGKKTVEVRKTKPKIETPFKCYIYCTKDFKSNKKYGYKTWASRGKVIGEFVCDEITSADVVLSDRVGWFVNCMSAFKGSCLEEGDILTYCSRETAVYGWHISDLVIYDKSKELYEFYRKCENMACEGCEHLKYQRVNANEYDYDCEYFGYKIPITRPPQSWCYVEEID